MDIIKPISVTESMLTYSSVSEDDYSEWGESTVYTIGDYCISLSTHKIYLCEVASTGDDPTDSTNIYDDSDSTDITGFWKEVSSTNKWKMFDERTRSITKDSERISVEVTPGDFFNSIALLNLSAERVVVRVTDTTDGTVYTNDVSLVDNSEVVGLYSWLFSPIIRKKSITLKDLPAYSSTKLSVTISNGADTASVGELVLGRLRYIGALQWGYEVELEDYSTKESETDEDGVKVTTLEEGTYSDTGTFDVGLKTSLVRSVKLVLASHRAKPIVYIGHADHEETIIYGYFTSFDVSVSNNAISYCTLEIEELS